MQLFECDMCHTQCKTTEQQIGSKLYDICGDCWGKLLSKLHGRGTAVKVPDVSDILNRWHKRESEKVDRIKPWTLEMGDENRPAFITGTTVVNKAKLVDKPHF